MRPTILHDYRSRHGATQPLISAQTPTLQKINPMQGFFGKQAQRRACWNRVADSSNFAAVRKNRFVKRRRSHIAGKREPART